MTMIICKGCGGEKPETEFYRHAKMANGRLSYCKTCVKNRVTRHRENNIEKVREYDRARGLLPERKKQVKERAWKYEKSRKEILKNDRETNPHKYAARSYVNNGIRRKTIIKPNFCERCHKELKLQAHHEDYSKPAEIVWLCSGCHGERHREINEMERR